MTRLRAARSDELRCHCGHLLARWVGERLELKCRRCKRCILLDVAPKAAPPEASSPIDAGEIAGEPVSGRR
jgi:phage FluMu protein Com